MPSAPKSVPKFASKIVLHCPTGYHTELDALVEQFLADGVKLIVCAGADCALVSDIIGELVVGDGTDPSRFIRRAAQPEQTLEEAVAFARLVSSAGDGEPQVVVLGVQARAYSRFNMNREWQCGQVKRLWTMMS